MSAILLRVLVYALIFGAIYFGLRSIINDWRGRFRQMDKDRHEQDLRERERPDVVELKRDQDGVYRPSDDDGSADDKK